MKIKIFKFASIFKNGSLYALKKSLYFYLQFFVITFRLIQIKSLPIYIMAGIGDY
jgi:hypothetical protein